MDSINAFNLFVFCAVWFYVAFELSVYFDKITYYLPSNFTLVSIGPPKLSLKPFAHLGIMQIYPSSEFFYQKLEKLSYEYWHKIRWNRNSVAKLIEKWIIVLSFSITFINFDQKNIHNFDMLCLFKQWILIVLNQFHQILTKEC